MEFSIPPPGEAGGPIRRFASSPAAVGLVSESFFFMPTTTSRAGAADEMLEGQRGLVKNSGVSGIEGFGIPFGI